MRRLIGTFYLLAQKLVFCNSDLDNRPPFVRWGIWRFPQSLFGFGNIYTSIKYTSMRCTPMRYTPMRCTLMRYTREIYAHCSVAFLGGYGGAGVGKDAPEPRCLRSLATTTSTRFTKHNEHP